jgi:hypothetical protein
MSELIDMTGWVMSDHGIPDSKLTVIERANPPEHLKDKHYTFWKCQCECGSTTIVRRDALINGKTKSCGCIHDQKSAERLRTMFTKDYRQYDKDGVLVKKFCPTCERWLDTNDFTPRKTSLDQLSWECKECKAYYLRNRYNAYKGEAKHRKINFDLSLEEFDNITSKQCTYCGGNNGYYLGKTFNGIDRVDSSIGYEINNCTPCCTICNSMKSSHTVNDWMNHMSLILNYYNKIEGDLIV